MPWLEIQIVVAVVMFGVIAGLIVSHLSARKMKVEIKATDKRRTTKKARQK